MACFGFRRLLKNLIKFRTTGRKEEKAPPPTPVNVGRRLRSSQWDMEGFRACQQVLAEREPGQYFGMVVRTKAEAAAGVPCVVYPQ